MRQLDVFTNETLAGHLTEAEPGRGYTFAYDADYVASELPAVSVSLPKRIEPYVSDDLFPFFSNMLPEGANRRVICRGLRIDEKDLFGLLTAMADADFIGAVSVKKCKG